MSAMRWGRLEPSSEDNGPRWPTNPPRVVTQYFVVSLSPFTGHYFAKSVFATPAIVQHHVRLRFCSFLLTTHSPRPRSPQRRFGLRIRSLAMPPVRSHLPSTDDCKKRKRSQYDDSDDMAFVTQSNKQQLVPPPAPMRKLSERMILVPNDLDDFLSSDLELSFASTMSLNSPPGSPPMGSSILPLDLKVPSHVAMDVSPAPTRSSTLAVPASGHKTRPRALTSARTFGRELGNQLTPPSARSASFRSTSGKKLQRSALPTEWLGQFAQDRSVEVSSL